MKGKRTQKIMLKALNALIGIGSKEELKEFIEEKYGCWIGAAYYCLDEYDVVIKTDRSLNVLSIGFENHQK